MGCCECAPSSNLCLHTPHCAALNKLQVKRFSLCCRGAIVDTDDLVEALKSGRLQGYGGMNLSAFFVVIVSQADVAEWGMSQPG